MRILIVDDEAPLAEALRVGLGRLGFAVDVALDGDEAMWLADENPYDAVVLDIMLPGVNGYEVCDRLRQSENWVPVLMLTAKDGELDEVEALDTGADDYLSKPFSFHVLVAHLRALVRRGTPRRPVVLEAGDLRLDPVHHQCWRGEIGIDLRPREFSLLEFMMRRAGEVLRRREILDNVWDFAFDGGSNVLDVYIGYLRRKIDEPFGRQALQTARGVGYRLDPDGG